jgi:hypothetical protein
MTKYRKFLSFCTTLDCLNISFFLFRILIIYIETWQLLINKPTAMSHSFTRRVLHLPPRDGSPYMTFNRLVFVEKRLSLSRTPGPTTTRAKISSRGSRSSSSSNRQIQVLIGSKRASKQQVFQKTFFHIYNYVRGNGEGTVRWSNFDRRDPKMWVFLQSTEATTCGHLLKWKLTPKTPPADTMFMAAMAMVLPWRIVEDFQSYVKNAKL